MISNNNKIYKGKVLFVATYGGFLSSFEMNNMHILKNMGYEVHCAANFDNKQYNERPQILSNFGVVKHNILFDRSPFSGKNFICYKKLEKLIIEENYILIDTHNPVVSVLSRLAARKTKNSKIVYTAHGFFFYKGCPFKNKLVYKTIESIMARKTDYLITINKEDFEAAKKMKLRKMAIYVPGIGLDKEKIDLICVNRKEKRTELGIGLNTTIIIMVGELIDRKNYLNAFNSFKKINMNDVKVLICGTGEKQDEYTKYVKENGLEDKVVFLGFRYDVIELLKSSDIFLFPSYQEGLSVALMEAMACKLPIIASKIRGNVDLIDNNGGILVDTKSIDEISLALNSLINKTPEEKEKMGLYNYQKVDNFTITKVDEIMKQFYKEIL